jgi:23S rRNA (pseudouridine1915-N3)-methyltransferase
VKLAIVAVGRLKNGPERELVDRYRERIEGTSRALGFTGFEMIELPESRARREADRRAEEAAAILARVGAGPVVAFDEHGKTPASDAFAEKLRRWRDEGRANVAFVIGGADGLDPAIQDRADWIVSFGALTIPHQIVRALVAEQVYRSLTILSGHPYHRAGHDDS